ncbi:hypothetical protein BV25DRAFT_1918961 [Artomyces pyxidatus]|uniref:Uncharacterized protein n=1 Tax=Artomyces pyxidatus TaxID=48021 RepID=A0ACB8SSL3_9AGAM|nr:hypothetical protein BV25DRAFT_1918961 [Artomyces pyxidatus]
MRNPSSDWSRSLSGAGTTGTSTSTSTKWTEEYPMKDQAEKKGGFNTHYSDVPITPLTPAAVKANADALLPPPAVAKDGSTASGRQKRKKSARVESGLRVHWARFRRRLGTGTSPSTSSLMDESTGESSVMRQHIKGPYGEDDEVDEVVVDRNWAEEIKSSVSQSEAGDSPEKSQALGGANASTDHESVALHIEGFWAICTPLIILRWRLWPAIVDFFSLRFFDERSEQYYTKENWFMRKSLALWSSVFLIINWFLATLLVPKPRVLADEIFFYGVAPAFTFPVLVMVMFDWPRDRANVYQFVLSISIWMWALYQVLFIFLCGKYNAKQSHFTCGDKDFLSMFYYACGLPTIAMFGLKMKRLPAAISAWVWAAIAIGLILPNHTTWIRNILNFLVFQGFLIYVHFMLETSERRLYTLRDRLKIQFRATQKAQVNERKAADSKRRLTSYVFHDKSLSTSVRVPLNTALLAVQNMEASGVVPRAQDIEFKALEGSLSMMSKVLNDVLDFNRMDSGRFESVFKPYSFHQVIQSLFVPLRLAADARQLEFSTDLDKSIDLVARYSAYHARGMDPKDIQQALQENPDEDGIVVGDETRLMQIITNLASNACKFTPPGGMLRVTTKLLLPPSEREPWALTNFNAEVDIDQPKEREAEPNLENGLPTCGLTDEDERHHLGGSPLSADTLSQHNMMHAKVPELIVVRIEVTDTGYGIPPKDMMQSKLFSAFNQTEQGKQQGGKGTGLGLALVRQIVKRSGGRLGVKSKVGKGSTFWVELPLGVGAKANIPPSPYQHYQPISEHAVHPAEHAHSEGLHRSPSTSLAAGLMSNATRSMSSTSSDQTHRSGLVELVSKPGGALTRTLNDTIPHAHDVLPEDAERLDSPTIPAVLPRTIEDSSTPKSTRRLQDRIQLPLPAFDPQNLHAPASTSSTSTAVNRENGAPGTPTGSSHENDPPPVPPGLHVLVVDDDSLTRMLMNRMLSRLGCKVSTAENGDIALQMILGPDGFKPPPNVSFSDEMVENVTGEQRLQNELVRSKYAIVFLDNQMPVMSGLKAVSRLRELGRKDFVVGVTGNALLADQEEYLEAGVDHVLTKPVLERSLRNMLVLAGERRHSVISSAPSSP